MSTSTVRTHPHEGGLLDDQGAIALAKEVHEQGCARLDAVGAEGGVQRAGCVAAVVHEAFSWRAHWLRRSSTNMRPDMVGRGGVTVAPRHPAPGHGQAPQPDAR